MTLDNFKEGEAETLRSVLARLDRMIERHPNVIPTRKLIKLKKEMARWESGIDSECILLQ